MQQPIRVAVSGAAGQVAYSLLYIIANGEIFGKNQPIILQLHELENNLTILNGISMELMDCAFPLLKDVIVTSNLAIAFKDISAAILLGSPRKDGQSNMALLDHTAFIFKEQGKALDQYARKDVKVVVVAHPTNTNTFLCSQFAPSIPKKNFTALLRLNQNRASALIASKWKVPVKAVENVIIWGNNSDTQVPDLRFATISQNGLCKFAYNPLRDEEFFKKTFADSIKKRDAAISDTKRTPGLSCAKAIRDHMHDWWHGTSPCKFVSMGVISDGSYGIPENIVCSLPVTTKNKNWRIFQGLEIDGFIRPQLQNTAKELEAEKQHALDKLAGIS